MAQRWSHAANDEVDIYASDFADDTWDCPECGEGLVQDDDALVCFGCGFEL